jgi:hypothetical protein
MSRHHRILRAAGRQVARCALVGASLRVGAAVAGVLAIAVIGGAGFTAWAIVWWVRVVEPRLFAPRFPPPAPPALPTSAPVRSGDERHLAFAQALAAVAARYLAECEAESRP